MNLEKLIQRKVENDERSGWSEPIVFDLSKTSDQSAVEKLLTDESVGVEDAVVPIAEDLFDVQHPELAKNQSAKDEYVNDTVTQGLDFGKWIYFPWEKRLVRYADREDHYALVTARNQNLITREEQALLGRTTVAIAGQSVGSNVAIVAGQTGFGGLGGKIVLFDKDTVSPTNLNRTLFNLNDVGLSKVDATAMKLSKINPYTEQVHYKDGYDPKLNHDLAQLGIKLFYEETDNVTTKAEIRDFAKENHIPLIMASDIGFSSVVDVERYDSEADAKAFNGKISAKDYQSLLAGSLTPGRKRQIMGKIAGMKDLLNSRMLSSIMEVDKTLNGLPQLGVVAFASAALAVQIGIGVTLGRKVESGSYALPRKSSPGFSPPEKFPDSLSTLIDFAKYYKAQNQKK